MTDAPSPRPILQVAAPPRPWVLPLGVGVAVVAGVIVLTTMNRARVEKTEAPAAPAAFEPPPPPLQPLDAAPDQPTYDGSVITAPHLLPQTPPISSLRTLSPTPMRAAMPATNADQHLRAPAVVVELGAAPTGALAAGGVTPAATAAASAKEAESDEAFAQRVSGAGAPISRSRPLGDPSLTAVQGSVLPAVLETAINSDVPGFVRAVVSRDVRAFDGVSIVIPRGSKLIGQYRNAVAAGQSRAFVVWTRCIRPDGVSIDLGSPAADPLGQAGLAGETDRHFFRRFGAAISLSVLNAGLSAASDNDGRIVIDSAQDASRVAELALQKQIDIPPTIRIPQGAPLTVFLARDLVFAR